MAENKMFNLSGTGNEGLVMKDVEASASAEEQPDEVEAVAGKEKAVEAEGATESETEEKPEGEETGKPEFDESNYRTKLRDGEELSITDLKKRVVSADDLQKIEIQNEILRRYDSDPRVRKLYDAVFSPEANPEVPVEKPSKNALLESFRSQLDEEDQKIFDPMVQVFHEQERELKELRAGIEDIRTLPDRQKKEAQLKEQEALIKSDVEYLLEQGATEDQIKKVMNVLFNPLSVGNYLRKIHGLMFGNNGEIENAKREAAQKREEEIRKENRTRGPRIARSGGAAIITAPTNPKTHLEVNAKSLMDLRKVKAS